MQNFSPEERKQFYESLPRKRVGAGVLFLNEGGELLIVRPGYRDDGWIVPGRVVDKDESPKAAAIREVREELGLDVPDMKFLGVGYVPGDETGERIQFIFLGGVLTDEQISQIRLQDSELEEMRFMTLDEGLALLRPNLQRRIRDCFNAIKGSIPIYLEE